MRAGRYFKNGKLDSEFGTDGMATISINLTPAYRGAPSVALDNLGRIIISFYSSFTQLLTNGITIARLTGNDLLDTSFNGNGISFGNCVMKLVILMRFAFSRIIKL